MLIPRTARTVRRAKLCGRFAATSWRSEVSGSAELASEFADEPEVEYVDAMPDRRPNARIGTRSALSFLGRGVCIISVSIR